MVNGLWLLKSFPGACNGYTEVCSWQIHNSEHNINIIFYCAQVQTSLGAKPGSRLMSLHLCTINCSLPEDRLLERGSVFREESVQRS